MIKKRFAKIDEDDNFNTERRTIGNLKRSISAIGRHSLEVLIYENVVKYVIITKI